MRGYKVAGGGTSTEFIDEISWIPLFMLFKIEFNFFAFIFGFGQRELSAHTFTKGEKKIKISKRLTC